MIVSLLHPPFIKQHFKKSQVQIHVRIHYISLFFCSKVNFDKIDFLPIFHICLHSIAVNDTRIPIRMIQRNFA